MDFFDVPSGLHHPSLEGYMPRGYKKNFMLNSAEHVLFPAH